jgi:uncharacterized membrane protein
VYPKARLDTLSDGIFAVAMTLLVLDVRLPDDFQPHEANQLSRALLDLLAKFLPYVLSFIVLGMRWLSSIHLRSSAETLSRKYAACWLVYHLLITCVPFTTIVVGRFGNFAPSIWLYAGNTILMSLAAFRMLTLTPAIEMRDHLRERQVSLILLTVSSLLAIGWSFIDPRQALWAFALNFAAPALSRHTGGAR